MSRKGNCYDNCIMEAFFGRMRNEMYYGYEKDFDCFKAFSNAVDEYIDYYRNERGFRKKQNGCLLLNTGKPPWHKLFNIVSSFLYTSFDLPFHKLLCYSFYLIV